MPYQTEARIEPPNNGSRTRHALPHVASECLSCAMVLRRQIISVTNFLVDSYCISSVFFAVFYLSSANLRCRSETCCTLAANTGRKKSSKICHLRWCPDGKFLTIFCVLYLQQGEDDITQ